MPTVAELTKWLKDTYSPEDVIAYDIWVTEDVIGRAKEWPGIDLSKKQAEEVLEKVYRRRDASIGINWDVLDCYIPYPAESEEDDCEDCLENGDGRYPATQTGICGSRLCDDCYQEHRGGSRKECSQPDVYGE